MREPTEVWVIIPPENPRMQWPMQFFGKEEFANAIADEHKRFGVYSIVKRYALTPAPSVATPDARRVVREPDVSVICRKCGYHIGGEPAGSYVQWVECDKCRALAATTPGDADA